MTNHTPAPWDVDTDGELMGRSGGYKTIAEGTSCGGIKYHNPADRDLILAAPDMYDALRNIQAELGAQGKDHTAIYALASNALKKARGEV